MNCEAEKFYDTLGKTEKNYLSPETSPEPEID